MSEPAWHVDPTGRHEHRWWDGWRWTADVADRGVVSRDETGPALPGLPPPPAPGAGPAGARAGVPDLVAVATRPTSGKAVAALTCGICGLVIVPFVPSIVAIALALAARADLRREPRLEGDGMATAGLVTGIVGTVLWGALILVAVIAAAAGA
ncbi:MAG: DUF4190 domain-containing protein [Thermoleophilia bacterium]|nr:DUF4190 domain-containing protein [Thermoleophilia bacterium]